jgi:hypothetical protein
MVEVGAPEESEKWNVFGVSDGAGRVLVGGLTAELGRIEPMVLADARVFAEWTFFHRDTIASQDYLATYLG